MTGAAATPLIGASSALDSFRQAVTGIALPAEAVRRLHELSGHIQAAALAHSLDSDALDAILSCYLANRPALPTTVRDALVLTNRLPEQP